MCFSFHFVSVCFVCVYSLTFVANDLCCTSFCLAGFAIRFTTIGERILRGGYCCAVWFVPIDKY